MGMAFMLAMGNSGSIIGSCKSKLPRSPALAIVLVHYKRQFSSVADIFLQNEAPQYPTGYGVAMAISVTGITAATVIMLTFRHNNRQREKMTEDEIRAKYTEDELIELGDRSPLYRYTL